MHKRLEELMQKWAKKGPLEMSQPELVEFRQLLEQSRRLGSKLKVKSAKNKKTKAEKLLEELMKGKK